MLKEERQDFILDTVNTENMTSVSDLTVSLGVTEMTIRRDLKELEEKGLIKRIHGGAKKINKVSKTEYSNYEKKTKNIESKKYIAKIIADNLNEDEVIFVGPGTTLEFISEYIGDKNIKIFTNSLYLFNELRNNPSLDLRLIGGKFRALTGAFVGSLAIDQIKHLRFQKAFIGVNGINENKVFNHNEEEGYLQKLVLDNAAEKYIVADSSKIGVEDIYSFYDIDEATIITDDKLSKAYKNSLEKFTNIMN